MNWGYKILVVYSAFVVGIVVLVVKSSSQKMDLVTPDYYGKELKFQQQIDATSQVAALSDTVQYFLKDNQLTINFPKDFSGKKITGNALLYCPSNEDNDLSQNFSLQDASLILPVKAVHKGWYELHLTWQANAINYYLEKKILIK